MFIDCGAIDMWWTILPGIIDKLLPDATAAADAKLKLMELAQSGELAVLQADAEIAKGQIAVNQTEASGDWFRAGWRPAAGWVCVVALAYQYLICPLSPLFAGGQQLPEVDSSDLMTLLLGMLGLGGFRTFEKLRSVK